MILIPVEGADGGGNTTAHYRTSTRKSQWRRGRWLRSDTQQKTGEDRSPPGATDGHCTLGRSAMPLGSGPVTPSIRDGSAFGWRYQWRGGTNRPGVTTTAISLAPSPYGYRSNGAAVCVISEDPSLRIQMTD